MTARAVPPPPSPTPPPPTDPPPPPPPDGQLLPPLLPPIVGPLLPVDTSGGFTFDRSRPFDLPQSAKSFQPLFFNSGTSSNIPLRSPFWSELTRSLTASWAAGESPKFFS